MIRLLSLVPAIAVTPKPWAYSITYIPRPVFGVKARILLSSQPDEHKKQITQVHRDFPHTTVSLSCPNEPGF